MRTDIDIAYLFNYCALRSSNMGLSKCVRVRMIDGGPRCPHEILSIDDDDDEPRAPNVSQERLRTPRPAPPGLSNVSIYLADTVHVVA